MNRVANFLILVIIFLTSSFLTAQIKIYRNITVEQGLVQSTILSIYQDSKGYVWIGTGAGLSRWDGIQFTNFSTFNGLPHERVNAITETSNGELLFGTLDGLSLYKNGKFKSIYVGDGLLANDITALHSGIDGKVYIGSSRGINTYVDGKIDTLGSYSDIRGLAIKSIYQSRDETLYLGTFLQGIYIYKNENFSRLSKKDGLVDNKVNDIFESSSGIIYIGTNKGLNKYANGILSSVPEINKLPVNYISKILEDNDGNLCVSTWGGGVAILNDQNIEMINRRNGLTNNFVNTLSKTEDGLIIIGTNGSGACLYKGGQFVTYNESIGLGNNIILGINEDKNGNIYFGSMNNGISIIENGKIRNITANNGLMDNNVRCIYTAKNGDIYICTRAGVQIYNPENRTFSTLWPFIRNEITTIYEDDDGTIYFGSTRGVYIYKDGESRWDLGENSILYTTITKIIKGKDDIFYYATSNNGLVIKEGSKYKVLNDENGMANSIMDFYQRSDGSIVAATSKGLFIKKGDVIDTLTVEDGLSDNILYSILEGDNNEIYVSSNRGLNILDFSKNPIQVRIISHLDGLASNECNREALFKDSKGKIWIGTVRGVTCYDPKKDMPNSITPEVHFTRIRLFENDIPLKDFKSHISFKYSENYFKINFIGIDISSPRSISYKYRMVGMDEDWFDTNEGYVQLTNLNSADYKFEVMAKNKWGYWGEPVSISFSVLPPFWETWWFVSMVLLVLVGAITFFVMYRFKQLIAIERLRTKIAADLHDNIGSSLTEISIMGEVLSARLSPKEKDVKSGLNSIAETSRSLVDKMSDIVWLVNPKRDSLYDLILRLKDSYTDLLYHKGISFKSNNLKSLEKISLSMECRQNLYLIFKEAIHNSLKHSNCSEIVLDANVKGRNLNVTLHDNGEGFELNEKVRGNGLTNMKYSAGLIGGELLVDSNIGSGTKIQFQGSIL